MLQLASPLPLVSSKTTSGEHNRTAGQTTTGTLHAPVEITSDNAAAFLKRAMERARSLHEGAAFSITFSDEPPSTPGQVMRLICLVQQFSRQYGLRYMNCAGWEFRFKKLATIPGP